MRNMIFAMACFFSLSTWSKKFQSPSDPLAQMELCATKKCSGNANSGRFGCARNCSNCDAQLGCQKWHGGTDLLAPQNTSFKAIFSGRKVSEGFSKTWGFFVIIESDNVIDNNGLKYDKVTLIYCHLNPSQVIASFVNQGDVLGLTGNTGNALDERPHLHMEAYDGVFNNADRSNALDAEAFFATSFPGAFGVNPNNKDCHPNMTIADDDCCGDLPNS